MKDYKELFGYEEEKEEKNPFRMLFNDLIEKYRSQEDPFQKGLMLFRCFLWLGMICFGIFGLLVQFKIIK